MSGEDIPDYIEKRMAEEEYLTYLEENDLRDDRDDVDPPEYDDYDYVEPDPGFLPTWMWKTREP